jgi:hypothetical protein
MADSVAKLPPSFQTPLQALAGSEPRANVPARRHSVVDMQAAYGAVLRPEGRDGHLELEQKDAWRVFFANLTYKIRKVKWSRERSPSPHRERGVIASEPRKRSAVRVMLLTP